MFDMSTATCSALSSWSFLHFYVFKLSLQDYYDYYFYSHLKKAQHTVYNDEDLPL